MWSRIHYPQMEDGEDKQEGMLAMIFFLNPIG